MLTGAGSSIVHDLLAPSQARVERCLQIVAMTSIVVVISMTFQIPDPALSAYLVFFVAKEDSGRSILTSVVFVVVISLVIALLFFLVQASLDRPSLRILVIAATSFVMFFLGRASKLAPLAGTIGLILAAALNGVQKASEGELATRGLLYAALFAIFPIVVVIVSNIVFGRHPERLLRTGLAERLMISSDVLRGASRARLDALIAGGNLELATELKMAALFHRLPRDTILRLKTLIGLTYAEMLTLAAMPALAARPEDAVAMRLDRIAKRIRDLPATIAGSSLVDPKTPEPPAGLSCQLTLLLSTMEDVISGAALPEMAASGGVQPKAGFFKPDAFSNPENERFAAKATAAVMICYLTFNLLDWSGISTCMITCFIVCLSTVGESAQKMTLRLVGCSFGAILGYAAIVFVLPLTTEITGLLCLVAIITVPAAWIALGSPRVSYIGFQIAFAAYLCVLQGFEPKFDLTIARDRFIGIVFGNVTVFVIFTQVYVTSLLPGLSKDLVAIVERCRAVVKAIGEGKPILAIVEQVAGLQALVDRMNGQILAYGFEKRATRFGRLHVRACRLIGTSLQDVVVDIARLAAYPPPTADSGARRTLEQTCAALDRRLAALATAVSGRKSIASDPADVDTLQDTRAAAGIPGRSATFRTLSDHLGGLVVAVARYRRILHKEAEGSHA